MISLYKEWIGLRILEFCLNTETPTKEMRKETQGPSDGAQKLNIHSPRKKKTTESEGRRKAI